MNILLIGGDEVTLPYYKIEQTNYGKQFFYNNIGYFNFWDEYLIMHISGYDKLFTVLVNRTGRKFSGAVETEDYKVCRNLLLEKSIRQRKPEEMFDDFPEIKSFNLEDFK